MKLNPFNFSRAWKCPTTNDDDDVIDEDEIPLAELRDAGRGRGRGRGLRRGRGRGRARGPALQPEPANVREPVLPDTHSFIQEASFQINGHEQSSLKFTSQANQDTGNYLRYLLVNQSLHSPASPGINLSEFNNGLFCLSYSCSPTPTSGLIFPATQTGVSRLKITFSRPLPKALQVIIYNEFPSLMTITDRGQVSTSFRSE